MFFRCDSVGRECDVAAENEKVRCGVGDYPSY